MRLRYSRALAAFPTPALQAWMDLVGMSGGPSRAPMVPLTGDERHALREDLHRVGLIDWTLREPSGRGAVRLWARGLMLVLNVCGEGISIEESWSPMDGPVVVVLRYPAYARTFDEAAEQCQAKVPVFESEIPGLINKTWGFDETTSTMCSIYHFEDRASAEARFASEGFRGFVEETLQNRVEIEYFDVAAIAVRRPLK